VQKIHQIQELDEQDRGHLIFLVRKEHKDIYYKAEKALEVLGDRETLTAQEVIELNLLKECEYMDHNQNLSETCKAGRCIFR